MSKMNKEILKMKKEMNDKISKIEKEMSKI